MAESTAVRYGRRSKSLSIHRKQLRTGAVPYVRRSTDSGAQAFAQRSGQKSVITQRSRTESISKLLRKLRMKCIVRIDPSSISFLSAARRLLRR